MLTYWAKVSGICFFFMLVLLKYTGVMIMIERISALMFAILLGLVLPGVLFQAIFVEKDPVNIEPSVAFQTQSQTIPDSQLQIPVLTSSGVQMMPLESYVVCVVLKEMPAEFEVEALKAQAVVARTYALRGDMKRAKHEQAAVCTDASCCQGYIDPQAYLSEGGTVESLAKVTAAVEETTDQVVTYQGEMIDATYFSCSGGKTEDAQAVWGEQIPYLVSKDSPGEENAAHYEDVVEYPVGDVLAKLELGDWKGRPVIQDITYTQGGGVDSIVICGKRFSGVALRTRLGLRSTVFTIELTDDTVTITTRGYGHRVGMSQYGAEAMALEGKRYDEILKYYYDGVQIISYQN